MEDKDSRNQLFHRFDIFLYSFFKQVKYLSRKQQRILLCLIVLSLFAFMCLINAMVDNNAAWLEGSWSNKSISYSFKAKNEHCREWSIKEDDHSLLTNALIAVNSNKKNIVLAKNGSLTEYHLTKLNKQQVELRIINDGQQTEKIRLSRDQKVP